MYHCHLRFCFMGHPCRAFEIIKGMSPLEHFSHEFLEVEIPQPVLSVKADVILLNLQGLDVKKTMRSLPEGISEKAELFVLAEQEQAAFLDKELCKLRDLWILPMSDDQIRFRFLGWQQVCKMSKDYWQTSQYLEATIDHVPDLIWYKTKDGIHEKVNNSFCRTVNKTKEQVEGQRHAYIWDVEQDDPACIESERMVMSKKQTCVSEEEVMTGDGIRLLTTYKSPLYDLDGSVMGTVGVGIDATQERAYEREITKKSHTLELIFTTVDCGIMCHSMDGTRIISVNDAALKILGYESEEELLADGFDMVAGSVLDEDKPRLREDIQSLKRVGDSVSTEYRVLHKNGDLLHVTGNIKILEENGERFYQRFLLDCTAQKLQEKKKERRQMELIHALSTEYSFVCFFDLCTGIGFPLRADAEYGHMFEPVFDGKKSLAESMECYIDRYVCKEDQEILRRVSTPEAIREELSEKSVYYVNYCIHKDGKAEYFQMKAVRTGEWEENRGVVLGFRSVDEEIRSEMEQKSLLEDALFQANKANRAKNTFLSNMSHDIRTPLNAVIGFTNLALDSDDMALQKEYLNNISVSSKNLLDLIGSILELTKFENQKPELKEELVNIEGLYQKLITILSIDLKEKQLACTVNLDIQHKDLYVDATYHSRIFLNIISNAIKYTPAGGRITVSCKELPGDTEDRCILETVVQDNGIGMSEEFLAHAYELFSRERNSTISGIQGTGLGLAIVKNFVDLMGGTVRMESRLEQGTKVTVRLPHRICTLSQEKVIKEADEMDYSILADKRILLTEDIDINAMIAIKVLSDKGCIVDRARDGVECVDRLLKAERGYYDLVLMDIQMPRMDGYCAAQTIRAFKDREKAAIPILAMTANAFQEDCDKAIAAGMNGHIAKPLDKMIMFRTIIETLCKYSRDCTGVQ